MAPPAPSGTAAAEIPLDRVELEPEPMPEWGVKGHALVHSEAMRALPAGMPDFFLKAADRVTALASHPDRWKIRELPHLRDSSRPDHWLSCEDLEGHSLPQDRYGYILMIDREGLAEPGRQPQALGTLPYQVAEMYQQLVAEFALWRNEMERSGSEAPSTLQYQENAIYVAGVTGHYIGDAAQPLHTTIHFDGWSSKAENPRGYRTRSGLHREFETLLVNNAVTAEAVRQKMGPCRRLEGDPLDWATSLVREAHDQVERLYRLEQEGQLDPAQPGPRGVDFAAERIAQGAQKLRDLFYSAWLDSEEVARRIGEHDPQQEFLLAR